MQKLSYIPHIESGTENVWIVDGDSSDLGVLSYFPIETRWLMTKLFFLTALSNDVKTLIKFCQPLVHRLGVGLEYFVNMWMVCLTFPAVQ